MNDQDLDYCARAELLKALAHPLRLRIVRSLLKCGCRRVSCIEEATGQSQSCISQHLMRLKAAGIVRAERTAAWPPWWPPCSASARRTIIEL